MLLRPLTKRLKRLTRKYGKRVLCTYLAALLPGNLVSVALFTPARVTSLKQLMSYSLASGPLQVLTAGVWSPVWNGGKQLAGHVLQGVGNVTHANTITDTGRELVTSGLDWFTGSGKYHPIVASNDSASDGSVAEQSAHDYYRVVGQAVLPAACPREGVHYTGRIDDKGRIGVVCAVVTSAMVRASAGHREPWTPGSEPAGWGHNSKVAVKLASGHTYHGYFWNRSHLLADSLGGHAMYDNVVTGTRMQNVGSGHGGMAFTESQTRDFIAKHPQCPVTYSAEPKYTGDEIIPRTVEVNVRSCDAAINEKVIVYNTQYGYNINYYNGTFTQVAQ